MNPRLLLAIAVLTFAAALPAAHADEQAIGGLYSTGQESDAGQLDTHYAFSVIDGTASGTSGHGVVTSGNGFPFPIWSANSEDSSWLTPDAAAGQSYDPQRNGHYVWSLSFDLTGYDADSAWLEGRWWADNDGYVVLNGQTVSSGVGLSSPTSFSAAAGFVAGVNTLEFHVLNFARASGNPTGVRVEFLSSGVVSVVPEADGYAMLLAGLVAVLAMIRRSLR
ncbi:hypothetical protein [Methyloversatilis thermotolerans]|uniref:hypothetical protein n=1 Tax=Methyloversatilis thermotolerans TaxID=1346290 RepID=UPI000376F737|nr:hypothetical protein [Methyloversatilis thermotolerans]